MQIIKQQEVLGKDFKIYGTAEEPLFLAKDVANWIEHSNASKMISDAELEEDEVIKQTISTLTNSYSALFVTESGLYEVLMQSRKPIAKQFKSKVKEILKEIRRTGSYQKPMTQAELIAAQAQVLVEIERKSNVALEMAERTQTKLTASLEALSAPTPKDWRTSTGNAIKKVCFENNLSYVAVFGDLYKELESSARVNLNARVSRLQERMRKAGATYKERRSVTKLHVIENDKVLQLAFDGIVRRFSASYANKRFANYEN